MSDTDQVLVPYWCNIHKIKICNCYGDHLLKLESENKRLREALAKISKEHCCCDSDCKENSPCVSIIATQALGKDEQ